MISEFDHGPIGNNTYHIAVFFRYSQDETQLIVYGIGWTSLRIT
jgi:hypothetical protein